MACLRHREVWQHHLFLRLVITLFTAHEDHMTTSKQLTQTAPANAAESAKQVVQSAAEGAQRVATAPMSTGLIFWDAMFEMWSAPLGRSVARPTNVQPSSQAEEI